MTYFKPYVDSTGLHIPTYNDILEDMIAAMKQIYGDDIYLDNSSPDYQLLSIFALKQSDTLQALAYAYNARSPETAIGASLDSVVKLNADNQWCSKRPRRTDMGFAGKRSNRLQWHGLYCSYMPHCRRCERAGGRYSAD